MENQVNNTTNALKEVGIKTKWFRIFPKSMNKVLKELSKKWSSLDK